jgi:hypothetical protein
MILYGCIPRAATRELPARLYNLDTAEIIEAKFIFSGTTRGDISFSMQNGEMFQGEYSTVPSGSVSWGSIYSSYYGSGTSDSGVSTGTTLNKSLKYYGSAVVVGDQKTIIECEYVTNSSRYNPQGYGACKDNRGMKYKLIF